MRKKVFLNSKTAYSAGFRAVSIIAALGALFVMRTALANKNDKEPEPQIVVNIPVEITDPLVNPDCGWGIWVGASTSDGNTSYKVGNLTTEFGDDVPLFSFVCIDWYWKDLEPQEGVFYWDDLDTVVNYWKARGKQINMRLWTTYDFGWRGQGGARSAPDWLFDEAGCKHFNVEIPHGTSSNKTTIRAPDYADPIYLTKFGNFLKAARDHYEPEPSFYFIGWQAASYGPWGEWHESFGQYHWPSDEAQHETCVKMQNVYEGIFGSKCQMSIHGTCKYGKPIDIGYETWKYQVAMEEAAAKGWALGRHSCLYPTNEKSWNMLKIRFFDEHWPSTALYGESSPANYGGMARGGGGGLDANLDGAIKMHYNWVHQYMTAYSYKKYPNTAYFERGLKAGGLGYRFVLTRAEYPAQLTAGSGFVLKQVWANRNSGKAWRKYPLAMYLTDTSNGETVIGPLFDKNFDQTMWIEGKSYDVASNFSIPDNIPSGTYDLRIAMVDDTGVPRIALAIAGGDEQKRYRIGSITVND